MKLINFKVDEQVRLGIKTEKGIMDVEQAAASLSLELPTTMEQVIAGGDKALSQLAKLTKLKFPPFQKKRLYMLHVLLNQKKLFV